MRRGKRPASTGVAAGQQKKTCQAHRAWQVDATGFIGSRLGYLPGYTCTPFSMGALAVPAGVTGVPYSPRSWRSWSAV